MKADQRSRSYNSFRSIIWGFLSKVVSMIFPFIIRTIIIYRLGGQYLGLSTLFSSILTILNLAELGFGSAVVFSLFKPISENDTDTVCALMNYYKRVYRIIGLIVLFVGLACLPFLTSLIKGSYPSDINIYYLYLIYLSNTVLSYWLFAYKSCLLTGHQRNDVTSKITILISTVMYSLQVILLLLFNNFYVYAVISPIMTAAGSIFRAVVVKKMYPQYEARGNLSKEHVASIRKRVTGLMIQKLCAATRNSFDSIVISMYIGLQTVAVYGNYYYIMNNVLDFVTIIATGIKPSIGNKVATKTPEENYDDMNKFNFIYMMISGWCTICMACVYQPFMLLWMGGDNLFSLTNMLLMCLYAYMLSTGMIRLLYYDAAGLWWHGKWRAVAESVTNLSLNFILGYFFGISGIIIATILSMFFINFLYGTQILYKHYFTMFKPREHYIKHLKYFTVTCLAGALAYFICSFIPADNNMFTGLMLILARVAICTVIATSIYLAIFRNSDDYKKAKQWIGWKLNSKTVRDKLRRFRHEA